MKNTILILSFVISSLSLLHAQIINTVCGVGSGGYYGDGGQATAAALYSPCQLAADKSGNIYIADYLNNVIRKITVSSGIITTIAGNGYNAGVGSGGFSGDGAQATDAELYFPTCVTLDTTGNIYIADYRNNRVRKVNVSTGIISTIVGTGTGSFSGDSGQATNATLFQPGGLALDNLGDLYIADALNNRIRKVIMTTGIITTIAGTGPRAYSGDGGQATAAELAYPIALTLDTSGNIFVADFANNRIRKITISTGVINTFAGTGAASYSGDGGAAALAEMNGPGAI
ncbi:MAG TPA: hypothetical protein VNZ45_18565, partial [Bacteroidia bacterium]|nr:hypothetical protein [Bacteroidia bacterium]